MIFWWLHRKNNEKAQRGIEVCYPSVNRTKREYIDMILDVKYIDSRKILIRWRNIKCDYVICQNGISHPAEREKLIEGM